MNANSKQNSMEKLQAASTSIPVYPKGAFLVLFSVYYTHLTFQNPGELQQAHSQTTQQYLQHMKTLRWPQEHLRIIEKWLKKWKIKRNQVIAHNFYPPERPLSCSQHQPNCRNSNRSCEIPRTTLKLQVKLERTHRQKKKTN